MNSVKRIDDSLRNAVLYVTSNKEHYVKNPNTDFTRNRKLSMEDVITQILTMTGGSLKKELYEFSKSKGTTLTSSAFVQQRSKIFSDAFRRILGCFNQMCNDTKKHRGYRLIAVDGTDVNCPRNPHSDCFVTTASRPEGYNMIHINALYDVCNRTYIDVICQTPKEKDERQALIDMLHRGTPSEKRLFLCDRGYESYNVFAHFLNTDNAHFLCRVKQQHSAMAEIAKLPMQALDTDITIGISTTQKKEDKAQGRRFIQTGSKTGKVNSPKTTISKWDFPSPYTLKVRVVRFMLDTGEYETLVTSLPREAFSASDIRKLYHKRWDIETSFRDLKYVIGLTYFHAKKEDLIMQEIYAALIMYNYCSRIAGNISINQRQQRKYAYKVNFAMATYLCRTFYRSTKKAFDALIVDICRYTEPIRPGRSDKRNLRTKQFVGFIYRVAA